MPRNRLADYWTLTRLAAAMGVSTQALRQRVERGTMKATKVGATWLVAPAEAERIMAQRVPGPPPPEPDYGEAPQ